MSNNYSSERIIAYVRADNDFTRLEALQLIGRGVVEAQDKLKQAQALLDAAVAAEYTVGHSQQYDGQAVTFHMNGWQHIVQVRKNV
jgi:hypothetical protein